MRNKNTFVKESDAHYLWSGFVKKFKSLNTAGVVPQCIEAFFVPQQWQKAGVSRRGRSEMLLNRVRPSKDLTTYMSRNLYIRIHHLMQMVSESLLNGGRGRLALLTCLPAVSLLSKLVLQVL